MLDGKSMMTAPLINVSQPKRVTSTRQSALHNCRALPRDAAGVSEPLGRRSNGAVFVSPIGQRLEPVVHASAGDVVNKVVGRNTDRCAGRSHKYEIIDVIIIGIAEVAVERRGFGHLF
jgi:hypothetical protein